MAFYVIGGEYADTTFEELVRPAPVLGPFETYQEALVAWRGQAMATIDQAYARFEIVESDETPVPAEWAGVRRRRAS